MRYFELKFLDKRVVLYPLNIAMMQDYPTEVQALFEKGETPFAPDRMTKLLTLFTESAKRGDPNVTLADVRALVDTTNILTCTKAILGQDWEHDEPPVPTTETTTAIPMSPQIGGGSTQG
jgi:hypothetical protein